MASNLDKKICLKFKSGSRHTWGDWKKLNRVMTIKTKRNKIGNGRVFSIADTSKDHDVVNVMFSYSGS